jgi:hypothetical protein
MDAAARGQKYTEAAIGNQHLKDFPRGRIDVERNPRRDALAADDLCRNGKVLPAGIG